MKNWREIYRERMMTPAEALKCVKSGDRVLVGHACGEPPALVDALSDRADELRDVEVVHMAAMGKSRYAQLGMEESFRHNGFFIGATTRQAIKDKRADITPTFISEVPRLLRDPKLLPVDVFLLQLTLPDEEGYCSFGISCDYNQPASKVAKMVVAELNPQMPWTYGGKIHLSELDYICEVDEPLLTIQPPKIGEIEKEIGRHVAGLVPDGATLQLGIGGIPDAVLSFLYSSKDLGIHSEMFSDGVMALANAGVVNNSKKTINTGKFTAAFLMGTKKFYDWVDRREDVELLEIEYVNDPFVIGQHENMISINSALQVDLMGQVNAEAIGPWQYSGTGGQVDFVRGASRSRGGKSIIAMPSTAAGGKLSRICAELDRGSPVTTSRNDVHFVVTEYGIADLRGRSLRERAQALIKIAHPAFRDSLLQDAKELGRI